MFLVRKPNIGIFPKWKETSGISVNVKNHKRMYWVQFKDPVSHMFLAGCVVTSWSLTQEVSNSKPFTVMTNIFNHLIQLMQ